MSEMSSGTKVTIGVGIALTVVGVGVGLYFALRKKPVVKNPIDNINKQNAVPKIAQQPVRQQQQQQQQSNELIKQAGGLLSSIFSKKKTSTPKNNNVKVAAKPQPSVTDKQSTIDASNIYFKNYPNTVTSGEYNPYWYLDSPDTGSGNTSSSAEYNPYWYLDSPDTGSSNTSSSAEYNPYWYQSAPVNNGD